MILALALMASTPTVDAFSRADRNNDGFVSRSELTEARLANFGTMDANNDGVLTQADQRGRKGPKPRLSEYDANRDGIVTRAEMATAPTQMFDRLDANRDGRLTRREAGLALMFLKGQ
jgi:Ca2+-binding EF-hand superfamily protein